MNPLCYSAPEAPLEQFFAGKRIAVTGAVGTVGRELVRQLLAFAVEEVRALDNNERELFFLSEEYIEDQRLHAFLCDVRSGSLLERQLTGMDYVIHAAALKQVPVCERSPFETVQTNIIGVENVIAAARSNDVSRVLFTSSDKAVNPTNVMGTTKLMGERLMTAANAMSFSDDATIFSSTRFGNVIGSNGSVIPLFCQQIARGGPVTLTHRDMTRFVMTLRDATRLVLQTLSLACGGEVFVTKMPVVRIRDLADAMIDLVGPALGQRKEEIEVREIGPRPGEKLYEELLNDEEVRRTAELGSFFSILPAFRNIYDRISYSYPNYDLCMAGDVYVSSREKPLSVAEIKEILLEPDVLEAEIRELALKVREIAE